jgi:phosphate-selective porin OprO/OprP
MIHIKPGFALRDPGSRIETGSMRTPSMQVRSLQRLLPLAWVVLVAVSLLAGADARANAEEKRFGQQILEILRDEGKIDDERFEELRKLEEAEHESAQQPALANPEAFSVTYKNGLNFNRNDDQVKIKLGGRIQADFASIHVDRDLRNALDTKDTVDPLDDTRIGGDGEGVELRRTRLYVSGDLYDRIVFKSQFDFAGGDVSLKDQYIGMKNIPYLGTVLVGHMKEPFSLEQLTSSKYLTFMERSLPSVLDSERNFGLLFKNHYLDKRMTASAGIFAVTGDDGEFFSRDRDFNLSGRVTGLPIYDEEKNRLVHLGVSVIQRFADDGEGGFSLRPEIHLAKKYLDTGDFTTDGATLIAAELAAVAGPFSVQAEWKSGWIDRRDGENWEASSAYVEASYFLTGESRNYKTASGIFGRVTPFRPFNPATGDWGAWQIAARYSWIDLQDSGTNGGEERNVTAALSWHLFSNVRLQFNYVYADVDDTGDKLSNASGDIHAFQTRAQIEF